MKHTKGFSLAIVFASSASYMKPITRRWVAANFINFRFHHLGVYSRVVKQSNTLVSQIIESQGKIFMTILEIKDYFLRLISCNTCISL